MLPRLCPLLAAAIVLVVAGCTTAPAPSRPAAVPVPAVQTALPPAPQGPPATIRGSEESSALLDNFTAFVRAVDGQHLAAGRAGWNQPITLKPGRHRLEVEFVRGSFFARAELSLDAQPGAAYEVRHASDAQVYGEHTYCEFWIIDLASGQKTGPTQRAVLSQVPAGR